MNDTTLPPEPGEIQDPGHGLPGPAETAPDVEEDMPCEINDDEDEEDDD